MASTRGLCVVLVLALLGDAFSIPADVQRLRRGLADNELDFNQQMSAGYRRDDDKDLEPAGSDNRLTRDDGNSFTVDSKEGESRMETTTAKLEFATPVYNDDDSDEDDDFEPMNTAPSAGGGGSNIFSLLRLANALFPSSSGANRYIRRMLRQYFNNPFNTNVPIFPNGPIVPNYPPPFNPTTAFLRRQDVNENKIDTDDIQGLKPPQFQRQETDEDDDGNDDDESESESESDENNAAESVEDDNGNGNGNGNNNNASQQKSESDENGKASDENNSDYSDEPPEGDGQGGGILGILAGLSGGDGQSDLGSLLATVGGIVGNLSGGEGFDLNAVIGSGIGLFVGLLSGGEENPGAVIASYLLTSLDTITGGGSKNNGAFFGKLISKLIRGTSAGGDPDASSEEGKEPEKDSAGFFGSFLMGLFGEMSKGSFKTSSCSSSCSDHPEAEER